MGESSGQRDLEAGQRRRREASLVETSQLIARRENVLRTFSLLKRKIRRKKLLFSL